MNDPHPDDITDAITVIETATALGLPIPAPAGTHTYQARISHTVATTPNRALLRRHLPTLGLHTTADNVRNAIHHLFRHTLDAETFNMANQSDYTDQLQPETLPGYQPSYNHPDQARETWFTTVTRDEALTALLGPEGHTWHIDAITITH